jgi:pyrimidine-specific ribonucleoside hydrolase
VAALDAINTGYGNDDIPLGAVAGSNADDFDHGYTDEVVARLSHDVNTSSDVPEAVALYRELLAKQPDRSVTIISVGGYTNIAGLLASEPDDFSKLDGRALIKKKVKRLVQMDGLLPGGIFPVTNQEIDLEAATEVVEGNWPTPIAWVDGTIGVRTIVGRDLCTDTPADHPMHVLYEILFDCGIVRDGNWDAPTFLYAIGDIRKAFDELGEGGAVVLNEQGGLTWDEKSKRKKDVYVHPKNQDRINERIEELLAAE